MGKRCTGNLKPAPFALTPGAVRGALGVGDRGVVFVPIAPFKLVDQPRGEDPTRPSTWAVAPAAGNDHTEYGEAPE